jgi:hypothetical protein
MDLKRVAREVSTSIALIVVYIVVYVVVSALAKYVIHSVLPTYGITVAEYEVYVEILLALAFGYFIVSAVARFFYWSTVVKYGHSTAAAVRNVVRIAGVGAMVAAIARGVLVEPLGWPSEASWAWWWALPLNKSWDRR